MHDDERSSGRRYQRIFDTLAVAIWEQDLRPVKAATEALRARGVADVRRYVGEHPEFVREVRRAVRITDANETALRMLGVGSKDEFQNLSDFLPEEDESFGHLIAAIDENQATFMAETRIRTANRGLVCVIVAFSFPPGVSLGRVTGSVLDISERVRMQETIDRTRAELELALRLASLGEVTASISHEVNQPLSAAMSYAQACQRWLARTPPDLGEATAALRGVADAAQHASDVVKRVRKLMGKVAADSLPVPVDGMVLDAMRFVQRDIQEREVALDLQLRAGGAAVLGDRILLQQVVINLVSNAVQAMGSVAPFARRVLIATSIAEADAIVDVIDTGPGFSDEAVERGFQAFYTTKARGMGLGLSISRSTVEMHSGTITIGNRPDGPGAAVRVRLPLMDQAPPGSPEAS